MPYSPEHKRDTREKILESARRLFNRKGYSGVSIEEIMSDAGLTHGGFYRHFSGKDELYAAAVRQFLCTMTPARVSRSIGISRPSTLVGADARSTTVQPSYGLCLPPCSRWRLVSCHSEERVRQRFSIASSTAPQCLRCD